jgi:hypothetical protein
MSEETKEQKDEWDEYFDRIEARIKALEEKLTGAGGEAKKGTETDKGSADETIKDEIAKEKEKLKKIKASIKKRLI